jgi:hypothetical protein
MPVNHLVGLAFVVASGDHAPLVVALPIIAVVVIAKVLYSLSKRRSPMAAEVTVRCSRGHVFETTWSPLGSLTSLRFGATRLQRCPVGHHWTLVRRVDGAELSAQDRGLIEHNR